MTPSADNSHCYKELTQIQLLGQNFLDIFLAFHAKPLKCRIIFCSGSSPSPFHTGKKSKAYTIRHHKMNTFAFSVVYDVTLKLPNIF
jgi:hypothetical protein